MEAGGFAIAVQRTGETTRLTLSGELDLARAEQLRDAVTAARAEATHVEIDLRDLSFVDSSGLRALMAVHHDAEAQGFTYALFAGPPEVHRTFVLTGLDTVFRFAEPG
jgi:anti-sigma B factor antagonist